MNRERQDLIEQTLGRTPRELVEIDDGYDFEVAIVDRDWVFRFPRRANVAEALGGRDRRATHPRRGTADRRALL